MEKNSSANRLKPIVQIRGVSEGPGSLVCAAYGVAKSWTWFSDWTTIVGRRAVGTGRKKTKHLFTVVHSLKYQSLAKCPGRSRFSGLSCATLERKVWSEDIPMHFNDALEAPGTFSWMGWIFICMLQGAADTKAYLSKSLCTFYIFSRSYCKHTLRDHKRLG